jgi:signal transduction histidine kinase
VTPEVSFSQREVLTGLGSVVSENLDLLSAVQQAWQPTDYLPDLRKPDWREQLAAFRAPAVELSDELLVVLVAGMVTEEALPSYAIALNLIAEDATGTSDGPWALWMRGGFQWDQTAEVGHEGTAIHLYRIAQEAVGNAIKHGRARRIHVSLGRESGGIVLTVKDNGVGMPLQNHKPVHVTGTGSGIASAGGGIGMHTMRYRANMIGGIVTLRSSPNKGTSVKCTILRVSPMHPCGNPPTVSQCRPQRCVPSGRL